MFNPIKSQNNQQDVFVKQIMSHWQKNPKILDYYTKQRQRFMLYRLQLQARIMLVAGLTITGYFLWVNSLIETKLNVLKIGILIEVLTFINWLLCKLPYSSRYPHLIFLSLSLSVTCIIQIDPAFNFRYVEPFTSIWILVFLSQATIVPVSWGIHLTSQILTVSCYLTLYFVYRPTLAYPISHYIEQGIFIFWTCMVCNFSVFLYEKLSKSEFNARQELEAAQQKSEKLLLNILPEEIAEKLKQEQKNIADNFNDVSVLFADIVGFTELSSKTSPAELVGLLNEIFSIFDTLAERHYIEKIKTIGDAYMAVAGLPIRRYDHAQAIANMALDMQEALLEFNHNQNKSFSIRIGISTGPVVAGVIGLKKFTYDLWGDTVNIASRMESHGIPGCIQVCETTYQILQEKFLLEKRGLMKIKGKGEMMTYLLEGKR